MPELAFRTLEEFPGRFDQYYNDHFIFRNTLIRWNSVLKVRYLKTSPLPSKVIIGKDNWLFYADEGALDNYKCTSIFSIDDLQKIKRTVEKRGKWLKGHGIVYYLMPAPEKQTIYPEFMPDSIERVRNASRLDQVVEYIAKNSKVKVVDVRQDLYAKKREGPLFRKIDTHWNQYGAFIVSDSLLRVIAQDFPAISPPAITDFSVTFETVRRGDLVDMLAITGDILSERVPRLIPKDVKKAPDLAWVDLQNPFKIEEMVVKTMGNNTLPRMVMFRDSFATPLIPFISAHFSRSVYVWSFSFDPDLILREKPNVVIDELNERYLDRLIINDTL